MIAVIQYGVGNLFSLVSSLNAVGADAVLTDDEKVIRSCDKIILPGVGAFGDAVNELNSRGLSEVVRKQAQNGKPLLGICLGMQLLFEKSRENGEYQGLCLLPGTVEPLFGYIEKPLKIPQIGWNALVFPESKSKSPLYKYTPKGAHVYFVHSYHAVCAAEYVSAYTQYGGEVTASVGENNIFGTQYHPEKSGDEGLLILKAFCEL